jgi:hypothetical protein
MSDNPTNPLVEALSQQAAQLIQDRASSIAGMATELAALGIGVFALIRAGRKPGAPTTSAPATMVLVMSGPIPDDVLDGLNNYLRGMRQDIEAEGNIESSKILRDDFPKPTPDES